MAWADVTVAQYHTDYPARYDLKMYRGSAFDLSLSLLDGDPPVPWDLSAYTPRAHYRDTDGVLHAITAAIQQYNEQFSYFDPTSNENVDLGVVDYWVITLSLTRAETAAIIGSSVPWELEFDPNPGNEMPTILHGSIAVSGEVGTDAEYP